ncbi:MAG: hypothetical protein PHR35_19325 [Kiritimatiellae bacterium]|nr:hypothetical protein [Kiritimatiellia bacterium]
MSAATNTHRLCVAVVVLSMSAFAVGADQIMTMMQGVGLDGQRIAIYARIMRWHSRTTLGTLLTGEEDARVVAEDTAVAMYKLDNGVAHLLWRRSVPYRHMAIDGYMLIDGGEVEFVSWLGPLSRVGRAGTYRIRVGSTRILEQLVYTGIHTNCYVSSSLDVYAVVGAEVMWLPHGSNEWLKTALPTDIIDKTCHGSGSPSALLIPSYVRGHLAMYDSLQNRITLRSTSGEAKMLELPESVKAAAVVGDSQAQWALSYECLLHGKRSHRCSQRMGLLECATNVNLVAFADDSRSGKRAAWIADIKRRSELIWQGGVTTGRKLTTTVTMSREGVPGAKTTLVIPPPKRISRFDDVTILPDLWPPQLK